MPSSTNTSKKSSPLLCIALSSYGSPLNNAQCAVTGSAIIVLLIISEFIFNKILKDAHPLLEDELNRQILARHVGVDVLSCCICALLGYLARDHVMDLFVPIFGAKEGQEKFNIAAYDKRLFTYYPEAYRLSLFFFAYQLKNLYDTIKFNDGPEFIFHHIFSMFTACAVLCSNTGGVCNYYSLFYFGLSEISTAVLCMLANFDDDNGVVGLGEAFPLFKIINGAIFIVLFILCRCIMWPLSTYYFMKDSKNAIENDVTHKESQKNWIKFLLISCSLISVLQVFWLGQIIVIGKEEFSNFFAG